MKETIIVPLVRDGNQYTQCQHRISLADECEACEDLNLFGQGNFFRGMWFAVAFEGGIVLVLAFLTWSLLWIMEAW